MILHTKRTFLRPLKVEDAPWFFELNQDPLVLRHTGDIPFTSISEAEHFLQNYDQFEKFKVGRFAVIDITNHQFLGWSGLKYNKENGEYDLGFRFFRKFWNKGFATETAQKCLQYGFKSLNLDYIIGRADKDNTASIRVLEKIGMKYKKEIEFNDKLGVIYQIGKSEYLKEI